MCSRFLWKGDISLSRGTKISWESCCTPKESGGLGIRRLAQWNNVLSMKLIWLIFSANNSLWVSWVRRNLIGEGNFWTLDAKPNDSWVWKSICKMRSMARPFIVCEVGSGISASFWMDNWTSLEPLLDLTAGQGPATTGLPLNAVVADAIIEGAWWIERSRSRNPVISLIKQCLLDPIPISQGNNDDQYLWKVGDAVPTNRFPSAASWNFLQPQIQHVYWYKQVWFSDSIPKHTFITWVIIRDR